MSSISLPTPASRSSYHNCPLDDVPSHSTKSRSKGASKKATTSAASSSHDDTDESTFHRAQHWFQARQESLLSLFCILLLVLSVAFYGASFSNSGTMIISNAGDGQNIAYATLGYSELCFTPQTISMDNMNNTVYTELPSECTLSGVDHRCQFQLSPTAQMFQSNNYNGHVDSELTNCSEFNAYRAFHVMGFVLAAIALVLMIVAHFDFKWLKLRGYNHYLRVNALIFSFLGGGLGVAAQCILIDWMNYNQKNLIALSYAPYLAGSGNTLTTVQLGQSSFYEVGGWVCAMGAFILYIAHFPSVLAK